MHYIHIHMYVHNSTHRWGRLDMKNSVVDSSRLLLTIVQINRLLLMFNLKAEHNEKMGGKKKRRNAYTCRERGLKVGC